MIENVQIVGGPYDGAVVAVGQHIGKLFLRTHHALDEHEKPIMLIHRYRRDRQSERRFVYLGGRSCMKVVK